jgi:hypothetical protein
MTCRSSIAFALPIVLAALLQSPPKGAQASKEELLYPTFEVSLSSRMFKVLAGDMDKVNLAELAKTVAGLDDANKAGKAAGESVSGVDKSQRPSAELLPKLPESERPLYSLLPIVLMKLQPLWDSKVWTDEQVALATQGSQIIGKITGAPTVAFKKGSDAANRAEFEKLVRWFHVTEAKPECLAAMIFTMDDGPYVGLPYEATGALPATITKALDEHSELRLSKVDREGERWVMQCVRDGKPVWARVISGMPDGAVADVGFAKTAPAKLGTHGWHVYFWVDWPMGKEQAHMYLDPSGNLLFYFLSW